MTVGRLPRARTGTIGDRRPGDPTLVFLHYWGGSHRTWDPVLARLRRPCGLLTYDQRGWGDSRELPGPFRLDQLADDAAALVEAGGLGDVVLVGHSMGAKVAQLLAARRPRRLLGAILVAPAPPRPVPIGVAQQDALIHAYDDADAVGHAVDHVLTRRGLEPRWRKQVIQDSLRGNTGARATWPREGLTADITAAVAAIEVPILVLAGSDDVVEPAATLSTHLLPHLPTATMTELNSTGHLSPLEVPQQVAEHVEVFVDRLRA